MTRAAYLQTFSVRQLRIYARNNDVFILQKWNKSQLIAAIINSRA
jgi:hypothetical protein